MPFSTLKKKGDIKNTFQLIGEKEYENTADYLLTVSGKDSQNYKFTTGNLIGCVTRQISQKKSRIKRLTLKISSRFGDSFLKYIIAAADGFHELPLLQRLQCSYRYL